MAAGQGEGQSEGRSMAALKVRTLYMLLAPIPVMWALVEFGGVTQGLRRAAMDWRYRVRGEIDAPVKVIYADLDASAMNLPFVGERPWDRKFFEDAARILLEYGGARVVGFDFVFSPKSMSKLVAPEAQLTSDQAMARLVRDYPDRVVLAGDYSGIYLPYMDRPAVPPLIYRGYRNPATNAYPEVPTYPIVGWAEGKVVGRLGMISVDEARSGGAAPRWAPLFYEYEGEAHSRNLLYGMDLSYRVQGLETEVVTNLETLDLVYQGNVVERLPRSQYVRFNHFSMELFLAAEGLDHRAVVPSGDFLEIRDRAGNMMRKIPLVDQQLVEIHWFSRWISPKNPRVSIAELYEQANALFSEEPGAAAAAEAFFGKFRDAIVLIGPVDKLLQDLAPTPMDGQQVPKVGVHGNLLKMLYSQRYIERWPEWVNYFLIFAMAGLCAVAGLYSGRYLISMRVAAILLILTYAGASFALFAAEDLVVPLVGPVGAGFSTLFAGVIIKLVSEERQKGRIKGMFGTYLSPALVNRMVESGEEPQLGGHEEQITAFFSDIQSFSSFSEKLGPKDLVVLMNEYLSAMTEIVQGEGGTLDKYIGDAMVAMFGAPVSLKDHAARACRAVVRVQEVQMELRKKWEAEGDRWPEIAKNMWTRVGLNTGPAVVGNMGSKTRFNYTMMGDTVNLAARCESGAKAYGVYSMVTEDTREKCLVHETNLAFRFLDRIQVKGRAQPVEIFELMGRESGISEETRKCRQLYEEGMRRYLDQAWDEAEDLFRKSAELERYQPGREKYVETNPSRVMEARCASMRAKPPGPGWDGVYVMKSK